MLKYVLIAILLIGCTDNIDEDMRLIISSLREKITGVTPDPQNILFTFNSGEKVTSFSSNTYKGNTISSRIRVNVFEENIFGQNAVQHDGFVINGVQTGGHGDNMPPFLSNLGNLGGEHGYSAISTTVVGHDKTVADDIYSVWQRDGGTEQIILYAIRTDLLNFVPIISAAIQTGIYSHVSGATNTSSIIIGSVSSRNFFPSIKHNYKKLFIDEVEKSITADGSYTATENIRIEEQYDILERESLIAYFLTLQGTGEYVKTGNGTGIVRITHNFIIDETGFQTGKMSFEALVNNLDFDYWMALQQIDLATTGDFWYFPKTLPITTVDGTFDFRQKEAYRNITIDTRFTSAYWEKPTEVPDRQLWVLNSKGTVYVHGFLPVLDASFTNRINKTSEAFSLADGSNKYYMKAAYGTKVGSTLSVGTKFEVVAYRGVIPIESGRTAAYFVKDYETGKSYFYGDWHDLPKTDTIDIPLGLQGKNYTVIDKTDNITLANGTLGTTLAITIANTEVYGYLTLEIN